MKHNIPYGTYEMVRISRVWSGQVFHSHPVSAMTIMIVIG